MSVVSEWTHQHITHSNESVLDILRRLVPELVDKIIEIAESTVFHLDPADLSGADKKAIAAKIIAGLVSRYLHVTLPAWVINALIDWIVARQRANSEPAQTAPVPVPSPTALYGVELNAAPADEALKPGDVIWLKPNGKYIVVPYGIGIPIGADWVQIRIVPAR